MKFYELEYELLLLKKLNTKLHLNTIFSLNTIFYIKGEPLVKFSLDFFKQF